MNNSTVTKLQSNSVNMKTKKPSDVPLRTRSIYFPALLKAVAQTLHDKRDAPIFTKASAALAIVSCGGVFRYNLPQTPTAEQQPGGPLEPARLLGATLLLQMFLSTVERQGVLAEKNS